MPALNLGKHYNFSLYANRSIGTGYTSAKLVSILDYANALKFSNIELIHKQVFPYLPTGTSSDHTLYTYYLFKVNNKDVIIADPWIIPASVVETLGVNYTLTLENISQPQLVTIRDQLRLLGIAFQINP